ncbi:MAG: DNA-directed RNA polymerase [Candidatus Altiarchaeales archaeon ex4484_96]|nr:MAG: DNA-directed RNA polymerase [Candidatus Altiarchaeales archaeon ex4484_96]
MYKLLTIKDTVRVPPRRFGEELDKVIVSEYESTSAGMIDKNVGIILAVNKVKNTGEGKIVMGDGAVYYECLLEVLVYQPRLNEVVEGIVTEITEFGAFVNFGPMDGLVHVSQVTEDFVGYDMKNASLVGKESKKILKKDDMVRARIVSVSLKPRFSDSKVGLTMRQPYLGKLDWLEDERKRLDEVKNKKTGDIEKK